MATCDLLFTGSAAFGSELSSTFKRLGEDENTKVRRTVAPGFYEVRREGERGEREGRREGRKGGSGVGWEMEGGRKGGRGRERGREGE